MSYLKNTLIKFNTRKTDNYTINDYHSRDLTLTHTLVDNNPDLFDWHSRTNGDNIESVAYDLYGNADYWDILVIINKHNPLYDSPRAYDFIVSSVEERIKDYADNVYGKDLPEPAYNDMYDSFLEAHEVENESFRVIKIVKPNKIQEFLQIGFELGYFI